MPWLDKVRAMGGGGGERASPLSAVQQTQRSCLEDAEGGAFRFVAFSFHGRGWRLFRCRRAFFVRGGGGIPSGNTPLPPPPNAEPLPPPSRKSTQPTQDMSKGNTTDTRAVDLFAGCGGLSEGFRSIFAAVVGYEADEAACATATKNGHAMHRVRLDADSAIEPHSVLVGGPPCQPFSVAGGQRGRKDARDMVPVFVAQLRRHRPPLAVMENVANLSGKKHANYLRGIVEEMRGMGYEVEARVLNAADFGVPQERKRLFVVAHLAGSAVFRFPRPSHAARRVTVGDALGEAAFAAETGDAHPNLLLTASMDRYVASYEARSHCKNPRDLRPDRPARTLTCRNLAGCTSDMIRIRLTDGRRRQLTVAEAAALQTFPQGYFDGLERTPAMRMIGNAVPPMLARAMAESAFAYLASRTSVPAPLHAPKRRSQRGVDKRSAKKGRREESERGQ
jgi:DNA (cytosine-5)-methyltransferase 1